MQFRVLVGMNQQQPFSGMMGMYPSAYFTALFLVIIVTAVVVAIALALRGEAVKETITQETTAEVKETEEILICPYCQTSNNSSAKFCRNCGASLEN